MESTIALPMILPPSQISSNWAGFTMRMDWRSSDPSTARRRPTSHPPDVRARCRNRSGAPSQSPQFVRNVNEDGVGEGCGFLVTGKETIFTVTRTSTSPLRMDVNPSSPADRPVKSPTAIHINPSFLLHPLMLPHPRCPKSPV